MSYSLMNELSESKLFPTTASFEKHPIKELAEWTLLNICALRILIAEDDTSDWAKNYARKTSRWGNFNKFRNDATDLYALLFSIDGMTREDKWLGYGLNHSNIFSWLRDSQLDQARETTIHKLFLKLDYDLKIHNEALKSIRRLVMDWTKLDRHKKQIALTRMLQIFRNKMRKSELLVQLEKLAKLQALELHGVHNPELDDLHEEATAGGTSAANVATVVGGIGVGFAPDQFWRSPYPAPKKEKKPTIIKR